MLSIIIYNQIRTRFLQQSIYSKNLQTSLIQRCSKTRTFSTQNNDFKPKMYMLARRNFSKMPKTPDLIYIPHVYRWLKTKLQFKYLQKLWDPEFTEGAFIYGSSKAVCRITEIIHEDRAEELDQLVTPIARLKVKELMKTKLTKLQKSVIKIKPEDIKILVPMNIQMKNDKTEKNVKIGMRVLALKWIRSDTGNFRLVLVALQTDFFRDYMKSVPDWTISGFEVLDCVILSQVPH